MRFLRVLPLLLAVTVIWTLNHALSPAIPAFGKIIDPVNGAMAAAEDADEDWSRNLKLKDLKASVQIWMDTSLIPHIRAGNDHDLYYAQGYIHAYFRLWQMDLQTRAAGGRVSEVAGPKAIDFDRGMRREGMVWGAQHSLAAMEAEPRTKAMLDAYRDGINAYIHTLNYRRLPIEYKLMGFEPEDWTNLRTALLMKYMARDLTGKTDDIAYTQLRDQLGQEQFDFLFPERIKGSKPVIPEGTKFDPPSLKIPPVPAGDIWTHFGKEEHNGASASGTDKSQRLSHSRRESHSLSGTVGSEISLGNDKDWASRLQSEASDPGADVAKGSNNWAISGSHTASGKAILCNDPHLALNLPSLWYEMQLSAPGINAYGASLPGAPGIVIGFNEAISWGFTNNYRDVKDFYEIISPRSLSGAEASTHSTLADTSAPLSVRDWARPGVYIFDGKRLSFQSSIEVIKVKGQPDVTDTVLYTIHGPVTYDPSFPDPAKSGKLLACTWMGHRGSNELLATYLLNRAGGYAAFTDAISHFECPAQNIAYADGIGNIAMWGQGRFINKWKDQGKYVMKGTDSSTLWGESIPMAENPHVLNPPQGYVASANQQVTDSTYPYWYNQSYTEWRSWEINEKLRAFLEAKEVDAITIEQMQSLQNDVHSFLLEKTGYTLDTLAYSDKGRNLPTDFSALNADDSRATIVQIIWQLFYQKLWNKSLFGVDMQKLPAEEWTMQMLMDKNIQQRLAPMMNYKVLDFHRLARECYKEAQDSMKKLSRTGTEWYKVKNTTLTHLSRALPAFSYDHLKIGGWSNTINAATHDHGPSWRMIVEMDSIPKAYAIYPGGQSGNPGSHHYGDFIDQWVEGKYHAIQFLTASTTKNPFKYTWTLTP